MISFHAARPAHFARPECCLQTFPCSYALLAAFPCMSSSSLPRATSGNNQRQLPGPFRDPHRGPAAHSSASPSAGTKHATRPRSNSAAPVFFPG